ncbi:hypothetical protein EYF80_020581 [Liparis tanakae]|uniref:Uncharacterized protein n=1 Tax=Liparis tanakae TaxID=230148 RepID=A0A4Z2HW74_9TELE|nr:hypothetical protein EYF80_020581 [Liparis tanakae]
MSQHNQEPLVLTEERVQWLVSSLENRVASFMNTATAFRMNVTKSWMWMKFLAQRSLLPKDQKSNTKALTSGMSSSTLQAMWYGGKALDQPPLVQLRLTEPEGKDGRTGSLDRLPGGRMRPAGDRVPERPTTFCVEEEGQIQRKSLTVEAKHKVRKAPLTCSHMSSVQSNEAHRDCNTHSCRMLRLSLSTQKHDESHNKLVYL